MFEAAELGRKISKKEFAERERDLHTRLLAAQRRLTEASFPVIVIVSGVEGAAKGDVVSRLHRWLDTRGIQTHAFWDESDEERQRPYYWRFWRAMPPKGTLGVLFGSWYTQPIVDRAHGDLDGNGFEHALTRIVDFERMLTDDGALIVKFWYHLSKKEQQRRIQADGKSRRGAKVSHLAKEYAKRYDEFAQASGRAIRVTDTGHSPWYVIEAHDHRYRDLTTGQTLLEALERRLEQEATRKPIDIRSSAMAPDTDGASITVLDRVDLTKTAGNDYDKQIRRLQGKLHQLTWKAWKAGRNTVAVFEGWDAAGKGGAIRRVTAGIDARLYRVITIGAPTDEERAQHYLWRFWRHVPRKGFVTIYDRSWYGRVLVERVEGFAEHHEWKRSYQEINDFEEQLTRHGVVLLKFWIHIDPEEQLRRFEEREQTPWKQHKLTEEDWRNRDRWDDYKHAINDMVARTSTEATPWTLVPGNDKRVARLHVLRTFVDRLESAL
jgi:AMP-polyphosphate phosphotransferase